MTSPRISQCNNFKDPGVQHYGGSAFAFVRDAADDIFCNLPAPVPSAPDYSNYGGGYGGYGGYGGAPGSAAAAAPVNMRAYNNAGAGCVHADSLISVVVGDGGGDSVALRRAAVIRAGDRVLLGGGGGGNINAEHTTEGASAAEGQQSSSASVLASSSSPPKIGVVRCVLRTDCENGRAMLASVRAPNATTANANSRPLRITAWHPVRVGVVADGIIRGDGDGAEFAEFAEFAESAERQWRFPGEIAAVREHACEAVFTFLIEEAVAAAASEASASASGSEADVESSALATGTGATTVKPRWARSFVADGVETIALAHGIGAAESEVAAHAFWGTDAVVDALRACRGWSSSSSSSSSCGVVRFRAGDAWVVRCAQSGRVVGINAAVEVRGNCDCADGSCATMAVSKIGAIQVNSVALEIRASGEGTRL